MNRSNSVLPYLFSLILAASLAACSFAPVEPDLPLPPTPMPLSPTLAFPPSPTPLPSSPTPNLLPPSPTPVQLPVDTPKPGTVVLDFAALACRARWANGAVDLPCPGDKTDLTEGYIAPADQAVAEGEIRVEAPVLIGLPGQGGAGHGAGLFGIYPPLLIQPDDTFHITLACQEGSSCDVEFALEYIDEGGNFHHDTGWSLMHQYGGGPVQMRVDLSPLAGQMVQLVLVVRDQGTPQDDWVLMIYPYVDRAGP